MPVASTLPRQRASALCHELLVAADVVLSSTAACCAAGAKPIHKATIMPRGNALGMVSQLPDQVEFDQPFVPVGSDYWSSSSIVHVIRSYTYTEHKIERSSIFSTHTRVIPTECFLLEHEPSALKPSDTSRLQELKNIAVQEHCCCATGRVQHQPRPDPRRHRRLHGRPRRRGAGLRRRPGGAFGRVFQFVYIRRNPDSTTDARSACCAISIAFWSLARPSC